MVEETINATESHTTGDAPLSPSLIEREQNKIEFYRTYDVMTGVRIAATLGGFFSLMVLLVVYKSKCKSRSLSDENLEAAVAAVQESDMQLNFGKAFSVYGGRRSLGNVSAPVTTRFSSVGGGYGLYTPPVRFYPPRGRVSLPTSSPFFYPSPYLTRLSDDSPPPHAYQEDEENHELDTFLGAGQHFLQVPSSRRSSRISRRLSSITCSSCDTSYLERRGSALEMGLPIPPPFANKQNQLIEESWDYYYPIDIQVIQPTPQMSPCQSQNSVVECTTATGGLCVPKIAPLASISSCGLPSTEPDNHSIGSDSVFLDEELVDTEDEVEGFSTDSDAENMECVLPSTITYSENEQTKILPSISVQREENRVPIRRFSSPSTSIKPNDNQLNLSLSGRRDKYPLCSKSCNEIASKKFSKTSSESDTVCENNDTGKDTIKISDSVSFISKTNMSVSCDQLVKALQEHTTHIGSTRSVVEHCTWSQETLF